MTVMDWLKNRNVEYSTHTDPTLYYEILSDVCRYDMPSDKSYAIYFDDNDNVKALIPNYDNLEDDSFIHSKFNKVYFGRLYKPNPMSINTVLEVNTQ